MAYSVIANGGKLVQPSLIKKIYKQDDLRNTNYSEEIRQVINPKTSYEILII